MSRDAHPVCGRRDVSGSDELRELSEHAVVGIDRRVCQVGRPHVRAFVVVHEPVATADIDRYGFRRQHRRGRDSLPEGGREHERLEGGAGLALALDGQVELAFVEIVAAVHGEYFPGSRPDRDESRGWSIRIGQNGLDRLPRESLETQVDRRLDVQAAAEYSARPVFRDQLLLHVVREVRRRALDAGKTHVLRARQRGSFGLLGIGCRDVVL